MLFRSEVGVLGIVWHSGFLTALPEGETRAPLDALLAHYDHARALGAAAALAVGSDLDGGIHPPHGLDTIADLPVLAAGLAARGWSDEEARLRNAICEIGKLDAAVRGLGFDGESTRVYGVAADRRSEERRVGKECVRLCRSRWSPYH